MECCSSTVCEVVVNVLIKDMTFDSLVDGRNLQCLLFTFLFQSIRDVVISTLCKVLSDSIKNVLVECCSDFAGDVVHAVL